jgi:CubicO group peptidase (beta-lactamase class C family)
MRNRARGIVAIAVLASVAAAAVGSHWALKVVSVGAAYKSKILCSGVFVAHREPASLLETDLAVDDLAPLRYIQSRIDTEKRRVTSGFLGIAKATAVYSPGGGCSLRYASLDPLPIPPSADPQEDLPGSPNLVEEIDPRLDPVLDWAFAEPDPKLLRRTRAVVILHKGRIVAERYATGFSKSTPLPGWSMTKAVTGALVGILVSEGRLSLEGPAPVPEWREQDDPRHKITLNQLMLMSSGLRFQEEYGNPLQDVTYMLLQVPDAAAYAAGKPLDAEPGTRWSYSSGTTNIISRIIRQTVGDVAYATFPRDLLFSRLGMQSAVMEQDASGTFVGSSFMYATARDWAKFGQFYLQDGVWGGERILPEGWVRYARTPAPLAPDRDFGAHLWLKIPEPYRSDKPEHPIPSDAFHAIGLEGQFITVIPSKELVVVRLGLTRRNFAWRHDEFLMRVLHALEGEQRQALRAVPR